MTVTNILSSLSARFAPPYGRTVQDAAHAAPELNALSQQTAARQQDAKNLADAFMSGRQTARDIVKSFAKERLQQLREQMRVLTKLLGADPKALAKQIARIAKELRSVLKDYNEAHQGDVEDAALTRETAAAEAQAQSGAREAEPAQPTGAEDTLQSRRRAAGLEDTPEAAEMKDFIQEVRGFVKKLKETLQSAKIKAAAPAGDASNKNDPFQQAGDELSGLEKALDLAFRDADREAKLTDAPGSRVSITA